MQEKKKKDTGKKAKKLMRESLKGFEKQKKTKEHIFCVWGNDFCFVFQTHKAGN